MRQNKPRFAILTFMLVLASLNNVGAQDWKLVRSDDGLAAVEFPGEPEINLQKTTTLAGEVQTHLRKFGERDNSLFLLSSTELPRLARTFTSDRKVLRSTMKGILTKYDAVAPKAKALKINDTKAVELTFKTKGSSSGRGLAIISIQNGTVYTAIAIVNTDSSNKQLERFRNSVTFTNQPPAASMAATTK